MIDNEARTFKEMLKQSDWAEFVKVMDNKIDTHGRRKNWETHAKAPFWRRES